MSTGAVRALRPEVYRRHSFVPSTGNFAMSSRSTPQRSAVANAIYGLLDPIPFGFFVGGLIFDVLYVQTYTILWVKAAAWLITLALFIAIIPRLINLVQVWITSRKIATGIDRIDFLLNLLAIVAAIFNAFVHTRDAYGSMPTGLWLSLLTVVLLALAHIITAVQYTHSRNIAHA